MDAEEHLKEGIRLYDDGYYLKGSKDIRSIVEALGQFIETNKQLDEKSPLKPKSLCYIALCNYKIGNLNSAYRIALKAKNSIAPAIDGVPVIGLTGAMLGEDRIDDLIKTIRDQFPEAISETSSVLNENKIDIKNVAEHLEIEVTRPSKPELEDIIELFKKTQKSIEEYGNSVNEGQRSLDLIQMLEVFETPLLFAWEKFGYGYHSDFWTDGANMFVYMGFEMNPTEQLQKTIIAWEENPPKSFFGPRGEMISSRVGEIYHLLAGDLEQNEI
jgi:hypothetical protein